MSHDRAFVVRVVIDDTRDTDARVPESFLAVQWTRLSGGETHPAFGARLRQLLTEHAPPGANPNAAPGLGPTRANAARSWPVSAIVGGTVLVAVAAFFALRPLWSPEEMAKPIAMAPPVGSDAATRSASTPAPLTEAQKLVGQAKRVYEEGDELNREALLLADDLVKHDPHAAAIPAAPTPGANFALSTPYAILGSVYAGLGRNAGALAAVRKNGSACQRGAGNSSSR